MAQSNNNKVISMVTINHLRQDECLNILFRAGTQFVKNADIRSDGTVPPYTLENINWYKIENSKLCIQFRPRYISDSIVKEHYGEFDMFNISKIYVSKLQVLE